jgi:alpha-methylacyl-CoA racemase
MASVERPLTGIDVLVFAGLGPVPYAAMLLADLGCTVTLIDRVEATPASMPAEVDPRRRGQRSIAVNLRSDSGREVAERLISATDVLIEGMRPGAVDRLGFGPDRCQDLNAGLVYVRMTGWGQDGPLAQMAGHDINYVGLTGALLAMGAAGTPPPVPLNLLGDYAGGSTFAVLGVLAALLERERSGHGQVIDAAIVDGVTSLSTATIGMRNAGLWHGRGQNAFDGSRPWYRVYATADDQYVAVGAIEPQFYAAMLSGLGLDPAEWPRETEDDCSRLAVRLESEFKAHSREHWTKLFDGTDACVTPVLSFDEAAAHPHSIARQALLGEPGLEQPAAAPRFSRTPAEGGREPAPIGRDTDAILAELGLDSETAARLHSEGIVR